MLFILVRVDDPELDGTQVCKQIEEVHDSITAAVVRSNADKTDSDHYMMTVNTTRQAKERLDGREDESYGTAD